GEAAAAERARQDGIRVLTGAAIEGTSGKLRVASIAVAVHGRPETIACDAVLMAGGFTPSVHLFSQSRGKLEWDEEIRAYLPAHSAEAERSAGACRGRFELEEALADGAAAGRAAAETGGFAPKGPTPILPVAL